MDHPSLTSEADTALHTTASALLHPSLTSVAEDASTLAAQHQDPQLDPTQGQDQVSIDEDSLHGLQCAVEGLDYSRPAQHPRQQHDLHHNQKQPHLQSLVKRPDQHVDIRTILDPPDLDEWRERLFNVDEMIILSEEQFLTYFPHIDNVYSHRSTQHYKRKPLISHYWDCRLKGRPPGTPKSNDPNKKKRKRTARQRDLCDVKIKITEYFPGHDVMGSSGTDAGLSVLGVGVSGSLPGAGGGGSMLHPTAESAIREQNQPFGLLTPSLNPPLPEGHPGVNGQRFFTIQRVNGNGANGKNDGVSGGHRHTLEESDRVKKNSVQRYLLKEVREKKRPLRLLKPLPFGGLSSRIPSIASTRLMVFRSDCFRTQTRAMAAQRETEKQYHTKATGLAARTVANHSQDNELKLYGSCFCPFVQRVWIALETKGIPYQYIEVDPYKKPQSLLDVNPRGLVPALRHGDWGSYESSVLLEYLEDLNVGPPLLPPGDAKLRAHCRLWTDFINRHIVPNFYRVLQEQDTQKQIANAQELRDAFNTLASAADAKGPFFLGHRISFVDVQVAPWIIRLRRALKPYRGWPDPNPDSRWGTWVYAIENNEHIQATTSTDELYLDSYERYAQNRPNTSQVANAINSGRGLP
ncbi:glutathione transferase [Aspergillus sclerotiicarbonarius CBS 121057]|uniref:Glutathione transferase n=1 Tax=Aspergillus sclerotiicarbonarius (strain CBS 121057 / IBT 28362) TaxID=1448318 RepID=A0A319EVN4_ASPSB|nr:glutathione transferase [Aspergillus sclerotiicarbonarius CBS 121057]